MQQPDAHLCLHTPTRIGVDHLLSGFGFLGSGFFFASRRITSSKRAGSSSAPISRAASLNLSDCGFSFANEGAPLLR